MLILSVLVATSCCVDRTEAFAYVPSLSSSSSSSWRRTGGISRPITSPIPSTERATATSTYAASAGYKAQGQARVVSGNRETLGALSAGGAVGIGAFGRRGSHCAGCGRGQALSMAATATTAVGGEGNGGSMNVIKAAALAVYSVAVSVQPAILVLATKAVMKLVASCGVGYWFSKKGVLDQNAISSLSKLIFYVFQPCLLFVNVASTVGNPSQKLSKLLVLPVFAIFQILFGSAVGKGMEKLLRLRPGSPEARELRMCTSFANSGPLPLLFVDSIFGGHPDGAIVSSAVAYISFYLLGWSPMFWTAGYTMVAGKPQPAAPLSAADAEHFKRLSLIRKAVVTCQRAKASPTFKRIVSAPVIGCIAGMIVGLLPWGRALLLGKNAPLSPVFDALKGLGNAYLPAAILVLAGSLAKPGAKPATAAPVSTSASSKNVFYRKVGAIMFSRFIVMPFVAAAMLMSGSRMRLIPYDKLLWFVLLMEGSMPSAQNSVVILQMENQPELAASMAKTLTAVYLLSAVPIAVLLSGILQFVQL